MKIFKLALISIVGLFLVIMAISLLLPSHVIISRAIDVNQPKDSIYFLINDLGNWPRWMDNYDSSQIVLSGNRMGKGAFIKSGIVKVNITSTDSSHIYATWQSGNNRELPGQFTFIEGGTKNSVTVQWQFIQKVKWYPWEKFASIVSDKALGPYMEKSLDNLKNLAEHNVP